MDLEWLLPEQIQQILKFCQISHLQDMHLAATLLQQNSWNIENAMHQLVAQNDHISQQQQRKKMMQQIRKRQEQQRPSLLQEQYEDHQYQSQSSYYQEELYNSLQKTQQNYQYEQLQRKTKLEKEVKIKQQKQREELAARIIQQNQKAKQQFVNCYQGPNFINIKFRLAHGAGQFKFSKQDKVSKVFRYVNAFLRQNFDHQFADFDLIQAFPALSLKQKQQNTLRQIFEDSEGEVLLIKQM